MTLAWVTYELPHPAAKHAARRGAARVSKASGDAIFNYCESEGVSELDCALLAWQGDAVGFPAVSAAVQRIWEDLDYCMHRQEAAIAETGPMPPRYNAENLHSVQVQLVAAGGSLQYSDKQIRWLEMKLGV